MDILSHMEYFIGEYGYSLNSDDLYDMDLPLSRLKAKGGTMVMWRKSLNPFVTVKKVVDSTAILPLVLCLPNIPTSIHVALYLPTAGREAEFLRELANLRVTIDELILQYPEAPLFLRGDANASSKNCNRSKLLHDFCAEYNLNRVQINHLTYHHFTGQGKADSDLDVLLFSNRKYVDKRLNIIKCREEDQGIDSHHDALLSKFFLPINEKSANAIDKNLPDPAPKIVNNRHKIIWNEKGIESYDRILSSLLPDLRERWNLPSSKAITSVLLQATNYLLSDVAVMSNKVISLADPTCPGSKRLPKHLKKSMNTLAKLNSKYKLLVARNNSSYIEVCTAKTELLNFKKEHRRLVRHTRMQKNIERDSKLKLDHPHFNQVKAVTGGKTKPLSNINKLIVDDLTFENDRVPDGFFHSISLLKKIDQVSLSKSESYLSSQETYKYVLKICQSGQKVPKVSLQKAEIILRSLRPSVNDFYSITPAHFLNGGQAALIHFQFLINCAIDNMNNMSNDELNMVWACILHKGHDKDKHNHRSYRTISTCPFLSKAIDAYIYSLYSDRWNQHTAETQFQKQSSSHELAALLLTESITHSLKTLHRPAFVLYLDAKSAFDLALKEHIINNLFEYGHRDQEVLLIDMRLSNRKTVCEWNKILMGPIHDECGVEQGGINSSEFYKIYNNEQISNAQASGFGVELGPVTISAIGQADDVVLLSNEPYALQGLIELTEYYCRKYNVTLSTEKTKLQMFVNKPINVKGVAAVGPPIRIGDDLIKYVDEAEHVGIVRSVTGNRPHIMSRMVAYRKAMFALLPTGIALANRASPVVSLRIHRIHCLPVLLSGLGSLILQTSEVNLVDQNVKITLQRLQKLLPRTPHCVVLFLGGSLPGKAMYHLRILSLFGMISRLPGSLLNKIARYQLTVAKPSSRSWFLLVRDLCLQYSLPSPFTLLDIPLSKYRYKALIKSKVIDYWEIFYRNEAQKLKDRSLKYFNPSYMFLTRPHQLWTSCGSNPYEVHKAIIQAQMLSGRYPTDRLSRHWNPIGSSFCSIPSCNMSVIGCLKHYLLYCVALSDARENAIKVLNSVCSESQEARFILEKYMDRSNDEVVMQFLLDCSQFPEVIHLKQSGKACIVDRLFYVCRTWCYLIHITRTRKCSST